MNFLTGTSHQLSYVIESDLFPLIGWSILRFHVFFVHTMKSIVVIHMTVLFSLKSPHLTWIYFIILLRSTMCPNTISSKQNLFPPLRISSSIVNNYRSGDKEQLSISPSKPVYYKVTYEPGQSDLFITVTSDDDLCAMAAVQTLNCPVYDVGEIGVRQGHYQTMSKSASLNVYVDDLIGFLNCLK